MVAMGLGMRRSQILRVPSWEASRKVDSEVGGRGGSVVVVVAGGWTVGRSVEV
jgi:hypothetical protein